MNKRWQRIDPRRHLGAAIGWIVLVVVALFAVGAGIFAAIEAEDQVSADAERVLSQFASSITHALTVNMETRIEVVRDTAERVAASSELDGSLLRQQLEAVQRHFRAFEWLGIADESGRVVAATGGLRVGEDMSALPSFQRAMASASSQSSLGIATPVPGDSPSLGQHRPDCPKIDMVARIQNAGGPAMGVLLAELSWGWFDRLKEASLAALDKQHQLALELLLVADDGTVLRGPGSWLGRRLAPDADLSEDGEYLVGRAAWGAEKVGTTGWMIIVRQPSGAVLAHTHAVGHAVFLSVMVAGLLSAAIAVGFVRLLIRRLGRLAEQARSLQQDTSAPLAVPAGRDEISHVGAALAGLVSQLQREKAALKQLNTELDQRVAERTARIERLADDARYAAVTRERLRIARDLHDTLAHSMMALLTQIRLVRKLHGRWSKDDLDDELARAETVAASGLTEARAAIGQMRHNSVREVGLGPALSALIARFRERTGLVAELQVDRQAEKLADERSETAFRIVEEALHNVERHAQAQCVTIVVEATALSPLLSPLGSGEREHTQRIRLEVADDGIGFDTAEQPLGHYGLRGMHEQAALIEAQLTLVCAPGRGARVVLEFDA